jgi:type I restriction enzyme S subunit
VTASDVHSEVTARIHKWLGTLPDRWGSARLFQVAEVWVSNVDKHSVEDEVPVRLCNYVDVYKHETITKTLDFMDATARPGQIERFRIRVGDTIITKDSETADDIGIPAYVEYEADDLICGYHLAIVRPDPERVNPKYLFWALKARPTLGQWSVLASGVTRVGIRSNDLNKVTIPLPSRAEQDAIVEFLDREMAQTDVLVAKQAALIAGLQERRRAMTDLGVWRGLNPDANLKPTRLDTAPVAPEHWLRRRNKNILSERTDLSAAGNQELLTVSHITGVTPRSHKNVTMFEAESTVGYRIVSPGDLVINTMWAWMGALGVSTWEGIVSPAYGVYSLHLGVEADPRYFNYLYRSTPYVTEMTRVSTGIRSNRLRLYPEVFLRMPVVIPPVEEQRQIADWLDAGVGRIGALVAKAQEHIALATERRSALISDVVTGKIDVRTVRKVA